VHPSDLIEGRGNGKKGKEGQKGGIYKFLGALIFLVIKKGGSFGVGFFMGGNLPPQPSYYIYMKYVRFFHPGSRYFPHLRHPLL